MQQSSSLIIMGGI